MSGNITFDMDSEKNKFTFKAITSILTDTRKRRRFSYISVYCDVIEHFLNEHCKQHPAVSTIKQSLPLSCLYLWNKIKKDVAIHDISKDKIRTIKEATGMRGDCSQGIMTCNDT